MGATIAGRMTVRPASVGLFTRTARQNLTTEAGADIPYADSRSGDALGWARGVEWQPRYAGAHLYPGHTSQAEPINPADWDDKFIDPLPDLTYRARPFLVYGSEAASQMSQPQAAALKRNAETAADTWLSWNLARHLWTASAGTVGGLPYTTLNASLASQGVDVTPTPGTPVSVQDAVAILLEAFDADAWPGDLIFHASRKLVPAGFHLGVFSRDGDRYRVVGAHLLNADPGNPGSAPLVVQGSGGDDTAAAATWIYATGAVEWDSEVAVETRTIKDQRYINSLHARAERAAICRFHGPSPHQNGLGPVVPAVLTTWRA